MRVIAIEEHYWDKEVAATFGPTDAMRGAPGILERLYDYGALRIKEMDEAGIDVQVLSHGAPATQRGEAGVVTKLAPVRIVGLMMGVFFLSNAFGNKVAGFAAGFFGSMPLATLFGTVAAFTKALLVWS